MSTKSTTSRVWLYNLYDKVTAWFISTEHIQGEHALRRARMVVAANLSGLLSAFCILAVLWVLESRITVPFVTLVLLIGVLPLNLLFVRWAHAYSFAGIVASLVFLSVVTVSAYSYGGGFATVLAWLPCIPLTATFLVGRTSGLVLAVISMIVALAIFFLDQQGHAFPHLLSRHNQLVLAPFVMAGAILYIALLGEFYEWTQAEAIKSLEEEKVYRSQAEQALQRQRENSLITLESIADGVITTDNDEYITYMNPVAAYLTGWGAQEALGRGLSEVFILFDEYTHAPVGGFFKSCEEGASHPAAKHHILLSYDGREMVVEHHASLIHKTNGDTKGLVIVFQDISMQRELTSQLRYQATHDPLSDLMNRHEFEYRLEALSSEATKHQPHTLCTLDISQFKVINDSCGHAAGDELIRQFAGLVKSAAEDDDLVARLGGDEFALLILNTKQTEAMTVMQKLRQDIDNYRFNWEGKSFAVATAIGLVEVDGHTNSVADLLNDADAARQAAKERGRNRIHMYKPDDHELLKRRGDMRWAAELNDAIEQGRFLLVRQTILPLRGNEDGHHYEILLRCLSAKGDIVPAEDFLVAAERYRLMADIDRWVVTTLVNWYEESPSDLQRTSVVSINLSARSITDNHFTQELMRQMHRIPGLAEKVCFEITETAAVANIQKAREFILKMRALGCSFALDDFGKGMSSLSYLKELPVDYLKIDGEFVKDMLSDPIDNAMVEHVNQIAHMVGIKTVAEYAENEEIIQRLRDLGVDFAQGYGIDKPAPFMLVKG